VVLYYPQTIRHEQELAAAGGRGRLGVRHTHKKKANNTSRRRRELNSTLDEEEKNQSRKRRRKKERREGPEGVERFAGFGWVGRGV
jgi:hypothetical protein